MGKSRKRNRNKFEKDVTSEERLILHERLMSGMPATIEKHASASETDRKEIQEKLCVQKAINELRGFEEDANFEKEATEEERRALRTAQLLATEVNEAKLDRYLEEQGLLSSIPLNYKLHLAVMLTDGQQSPGNRPSEFLEYELLARVYIAYKDGSCPFIAELPSGLEPRDEIDSLIDPFVEWLNMLGVTSAPKTGRTRNNLKANAYNQYKAILDGAEMTELDAVRSARDFEYGEHVLRIEKQLKAMTKKKQEF